MPLISTDDAEDFAIEDANVEGSSREKVSEIMDGWQHIDSCQPPKPIIEGKLKIIPWVDVYDEPTGDIVRGWYRSDGWLYDSAVVRYKDNKYWRESHPTRALDELYRKKYCPYSKG